MGRRLQAWWRKCHLQFEKAYASQSIRVKIRQFNQYPMVIRVVGGLLLGFFGLLLVFTGMVGMGNLF